MVILVTWPLTLHFAQVELAPSLPPLPLHTVQILSLLTAIFEVLPLYISSRVTLMECWTDLPFLGPYGPLPPPIPPPKNYENGSPPPPLAAPC